MIWTGQKKRQKKKTLHCLGNVAQLDSKDKAWNAKAQ